MPTTTDRATTDRAPTDPGPAEGAIDAALSGGSDSTVAERLVAAAAEVFAEKGYDGAGVAEIARRAGLTTGAIYSHYSGKAELLIEAIDAYSTDEFDELFAQNDFTGQATDIIRTVGSHLVERGPKIERPELLLEALVTARREPEVAARLGAHLEARADQFAVLVDQAKVDGTIDAGLDSASVVRFCHAVSLGWLLVETLDLDLPAVDPWTDLIDRLVTSLAPTDATAPVFAHEPNPQPTQEH